MDDMIQNIYIKIYGWLELYVIIFTRLIDDYKSSLKNRHSIKTSQVYFLLS